jgi:hypothetical protein
MLRRTALSVIILAALGLVPAAVAAGGGPSPGVMEGWKGITSPRTPLRFVTFADGSRTMLASVWKSGGRVVSWRPLQGYWGVPMVTGSGATGGLSRDGRMLVLADWVPPQNSPLRAVSRFKLFNTKSLIPWRTITLRGDFAFDALSPGGRTLFLIQHVSQADASRYLVRAYDIGARRLLPRVIADRRQQGWVMRGYPLRRVSSADGRWVYTLYQQNGGYPFVHALDAVTRTAVCIGIPWTGSQNRLPMAHLRLDERHGTLTVVGSGREFAVDTTTFRVSLPRHGGGFPTALVAGLASGLAALAVVAVALRRRIRPAIHRPAHGSIAGSGS